MITKYRIRRCCNHCGKWDVLLLPGMLLVGRFVAYDAALETVKKLQFTEMRATSDAQPGRSYSLAEVEALRGMVAR